MAPQGETLQLSNGPNDIPIVHSLFEESTGTWQYVVADPSTKRCVIIDPTRDHCKDQIAMCTTAADAILALVQRLGYLVQHIFETNTAVASSRYRSAAWYLRMRLCDVQGWMPEVCSDATLASMTERWQKRHGPGMTFNTGLRAALEDGEMLMIGRMRVRCMHLTSYGTPYRRAIRIGNLIFGARSLAFLTRESDLFTKSDLERPMDYAMASVTLTSMQKILSLAENSTFYPDLADSVIRPDSQQMPSTVLRQAEQENEYIGLNASEFLIRWQGQQRARLDVEVHKWSRSDGT